MESRKTIIDFFEWFAVATPTELQEACRGELTLPQVYDILDELALEGEIRQTRVTVHMPSHPPENLWIKRGSTYDATSEDSQ